MKPLFNHTNVHVSVFLFLIHLGQWLAVSGRFNVVPASSAGSYQIAPIPPDLISGWIASVPDSSVSGRVVLAPDSPSFAEPPIPVLLGALNDALSYYRSHIDETADISVLLGLGITAGQLKALKDTLVKQKSTGKELDQISELQRSVAQLREEIFCPKCLLKTEMEDYRSLISPDSWAHNEEPNWLSFRDFPPRILPTAPEVWNGNYSDFCLQSVSNNCSQSDDCVARELTPMSSQYNLTHQIIFMMLAKQLDCNIKYQGKELDIDDVIQRKCALVYIEAKRLWENEVYNSAVSCDLFIEQIALCGAMGIQDFFANPLWLQFILQRQTESGLFLCPNINTTDLASFIRGRNHVTAVSMSALAAYLKNMILYPYTDKVRMNDFDDMYLSKDDKDRSSDDNGLSFESLERLHSDYD